MAFEDAFGRTITELGEDVKAIKAVMLGTVQKDPKFKTTDDLKQDATSKKIAEQLERIANMKLNEEMKKLHGSVDELIKFLKKSEVARSTYQRQQKQYQQKAASMQAAQLTQPMRGGINNPQKVNAVLATGVSRLNKILLNIPGFGKIIEKKLENQIKAIRIEAHQRGEYYGNRQERVKIAHMEEALLKKRDRAFKYEMAANTGRGVFNKPSQYVFGANGAKSVVEDVSSLIAKSAGGLTGTILSAINPALGGLAGGIVEGLVGFLFKPLVENLEYVSDAQGYLFTQYSTGLGDVEKRLESFKKIGEEVLETGQSQQKVRKAYNDALKAGIRNEQEALKVAKSGLRTGTLIGADATQTAHTFIDWNRHLGLTNFQLDNVTRDMVMIGRQTGIMGDNLLKVAAQSKEFMQNMRLSGTFTGQAANNIMGLLANAEKTGTSEGISRILRVLQGSIIDSQDVQTNTLLYGAAGGNAKLQQQLLSGTALNDKASLKYLGENIGQQLQTMIRQVTGTNKTFEQLTPEEAGMVSRVTELVFKQKAFEMDALSKNLIDRGKSFTDRLKDLNDNTDKSLFDSERANLKRDLINQETYSVLDQFNRKLKENGGNVDASLSGIAENLNPILKSIGSNKTGVEGLRDLLKNRQKSLLSNESFKDLPAQMQKDLKEALSDEAIDKAIEGLKTGKKGAFDEVVAMQGRLSNELLVAQRIKGDPLKSMEQILNQIYKKISDWNFQLISDNLVTISKTLTQILQFVGDIAGYLNIAKDLGKHANVFSTQGSKAFAGSVDLAKRVAEEKLTNKDAFREVGEIVNLRNMASGAEKALDKWDANLSKQFFGEANLSAAQAEETIRKYREEADRREKLLGLRESTLGAPADQRKGLLQGGIRKIFPERGANQVAGDIALGNTSAYSKEYIAKEKADIEQALKDIEAKRESIPFLQKGITIPLIGGKISTPEEKKLFQEEAKLRAKLADVEAIQSMLDPKVATEAAKAAISLNKNATEEKSIYTHDTHSEALLTAILEDTAVIADAMLPGVDVDEEIRRREAERGDNLDNIENNTGITATNTANMARAFAEFAKILMQRIKAIENGEAIGEGGESTFLDEILSVEWPNARYGRTVGIEASLTDLA